MCLMFLTCGCCHVYNSCHTEHSNPISVHQQPATYRQPKRAVSQLCPCLLNWEGVLFTGNWYVECKNMYKGIPTKQGNTLLHIGCRDSYVSITWNQSTNEIRWNLPYLCNDMQKLKYLFFLNFCQSKTYEQPQQSLWRILSNNTYF